MDYINVPLSNQGYAGLAGMQAITPTQRERYSLNAQLANQRQALATIIANLEGMEAALFGCGPGNCAVENAKNAQPESVEQIVGAMANQIELIHGMIARISNRL